MIAVGAKFGLWTVIRNAGKNVHGHNLVLCRCVCEQESLVHVANLERGASLGCRSCRHRKDVPIGSVWGSWTVVGLCFIKDGYLVVPCRCECGRTSEVHVTRLRSTETTQCLCVWAKKV